MDPFVALVKRGAEQFAADAKVIEAMRADNERRIAQLEAMRRRDNRNSECRARALARRSR